MVAWSAVRPMAPPTLDRVLNCPTLPTLPAVALKVLELTRDPRISIVRIAQTVQNDPALAGKVLKTVNSSYYALSKPCPNIGRAMSLLGLNTVKSIVLSFSLVDTTRKMGLEGRLDLTAYWRRAVYGAAAARVIAQRTLACDADEAFVGSLLSDIGMLACFAALRDEYAGVLTQAGEDHEALIPAERGILGFDHASVGRELALRWRLPPQLVECVSRHHNAAHVSGPHAALVRTVALAGMAAAALVPGAPKSKLGAFLTHARVWFDLDAPEAREVVETTAEGAAELSKLLDLSTGARPNLDEVLAEAHERLLETQVEIERESAELRRDNEALARRANIDGLTGLYNRAYFDRTLIEQLEATRGAGQPLTVIFLDADHFKRVNDEHGHQAGDAVLIETARRLRGAIERIGVLCRYGGEEFVAILPSVSREKGLRIAEALRLAIARTPFDLSGYDLPGLALARTISLGVATTDPKDASRDWTPEQVVKRADEAVYAAKSAGRNCVRGASEGEAASGEGGPARARVAVIDPNEFSRRVVAQALAGEFEVMQGLSLPAGRAFDLVLADASLVRAGLRCGGALLAATASDPNPTTRDACTRGGASVVLDTMDFATKPGETISLLRRLLAARAGEAKAA